MRYFLVVVGLLMGSVISQPTAAVEYQIQQLQSKLLKETRQYLIALPEGYAQSTEAYPVVYLLDADEQFDHMASLLQFLSQGAMPQIPKMIIVGINNTERMRDYTPTHTLVLPSGKKGNPKYQQTGGAGRFLDFIEQELAPSIHSQLRTNGINVLVGHSFGGLLAMEALRTNRQLFSAYIAIDTSLWFDSPHYLTQLENRVEKGDFKQKQLFMAIANNPLSPGFGVSSYHRDLNLAFADKLTKSPPQGLSFAAKYYPDETHQSVSHIGLYDGIRHLFKDFAIDIYAETFSKQQVIDQYRLLSERFGFRVTPPQQYLEQLIQYSERQQLSDRKQSLESLKAYFAGVKSNEALR